MRRVCGFALAVVVVMLAGRATAADPPPLAWRWEPGDRFAVRTVESASTRTVTKSRHAETTEEENSSSSANLLIDVVDVLENGRVKLQLHFTEFEMRQDGPMAMQLSAKIREDGRVDATAKFDAKGMEAFASEAESVMREVAARILELRIHVELTAAGAVLSARTETVVVPRQQGSALRRVLAASIERAFGDDGYALAVVGESFPQLSPTPPAPGARWSVQRTFSLWGLTLRGKGAAFVASTEPDGNVATVAEEMIYTCEFAGLTKSLEAEIERAVPGAEVKVSLRPAERVLVKYSGRFDLANGHPLEWSVPKLEMKLVGSTTVAVGDLKETISQRITVTGDVRSTWTRAQGVGGIEHTRMPSKYVRNREKLVALAPGESAWMHGSDLRCTPDGAVWFSPSVRMWRTPEPANAAGLLRIRRASDKEYDVDLTGSPDTWALVQADGTPFSPTKDHVRVRHVIADAGAPSRVMPGRLLGTRIWALRPGESGWLGAGRVLVDRNREAWVDPQLSVRAERYEDADGPALAITATERDVVRIDVTGTTHRWDRADRPSHGKLLGGKGVGGHMDSPFAVASITRDGRTTGMVPLDCLEPPVRDLAAGGRAWISANSARMDAEFRLWLDGAASAKARASRDGWDVPDLAIRRIDAKTFALDLTDVAHRWYVGGPSEGYIPPGFESGDTAFNTSWFRVGELAAPGAAPSATVPESLRSEPIWALNPGEVAWMSCRYVGADTKSVGWVLGSAPVRSRPFSDELGPAVRITMGPDRSSCDVDLSDATYRWDLTKPVESNAIGAGRTQRSSMVVPRFDFLRVARFTLTPPARTDGKK